MSKETQQNLLILVCCSVCCSVCCFLFFTFVKI
nr:MAG TPA: Commissureless [Caudoviricetes sp.]